MFHEMLVYILSNHTACIKFRNGRMSGIILKADEVCYVAKTCAFGTHLCVVTGAHRVSC
jgi:hypothetical protein